MTLALSDAKIGGYYPPGSCQGIQILICKWRPKIVYLDLERNDWQFDLIELANISKGRGKAICVVYRLHVTQ